MRKSASSICRTAVIRRIKVKKYYGISADDIERCGKLTSVPTISMARKHIPSVCDDAFKR
jgi:hypothetical protein